MRINGWQRLWLLASILWAVVILVLAGILQPDGDQTVQSAIPVRGAAVDRASRGGLWVRPWPRLGPPRISSRVKVAHYPAVNRIATVASIWRSSSGIRQRPFAKIVPFTVGDDDEAALVAGGFARGPRRGLTVGFWEASAIIPL